MSSLVKSRQLQAVGVLAVAFVLAVTWGRPQPAPPVATTLTPLPGEKNSDEGLRGEDRASADTGETDGAEEGGQDLEGEIESGDEVEKRDHWFYDQRIGKGNRIPKGAWIKAQRQADKLVNPLALQTTPLNWTEVGPRPINPPVTSQTNGTALSQLSWHYGGSTPYSGRITAIATDPTRKDVAFIGSANGGVWKTTNGGVDWTQVFDPPNVPPLTSQAIGTIAIDPGHADTVYVGTGEANFGLDSYFGTGLYRSQNGGGSWDKLGGSKFDECHFSGIVVQPGDPNSILVSVTAYGVQTPGVQTTCGYDFNTATGRGGIYRTTNGGANASDWTRVRVGRPTDLVLAPNNPSVIYAGFFVEGVWKSTNFGGIWANVTPTLPTTGIGRVELSVVPAPTLSNDQTVYAAIAESATSGSANKDLKGILVSDNGGGQWRTLSSPLGYSNLERFCRNISSGVNAAGQCWYDLVIAADPSNPRLMYAGGTWLNAYSSDTQRTLIGHYTPGTQGCPFSGTSTYCIHVDFHAMAWDAGHRLWIGNDGGIYRTSNPAASPPLFDNLNSNLNNVQFYPGISGSLANPPLVGGEQDNASAAHLAAGSSFSLAGYGDGMFSAVVGTNPNKVILVTSYNLSIYKLVNGVFCYYGGDGGGIAYKDANGNGLTQFNAPLVASPANSSTALAGTYRVYRTTNADAGCGLTRWQQISQDFSRYLSTIAAATDGKTAYAGDDIGNVYVTTDVTQVTNWMVRATGTGRNITDIWVMPGAPGTAYVTTSGFDATGRHILKTTDYGANWQDISDLGPNPLPNSPTNAVVVDAATNPATIYVGTDNGVFWTNDGGMNWQNTSVGLPRTVVNDLLLDGSPKKLIAATYGRGMWVAPAIGTAAAGPAHDNFENARAATAVPYTDPAGSTAAATTQAGENFGPETAPCNGYIGKTVWYRFAPATTMTVTADTAGSEAGFDTVIVAWKGSSLATLTKVACDDDGLGVDAGGSKIDSLRVDAGSVYYFQVGGYRANASDTPDSGTLVFNLTKGRPLNDDFANARAVNALPYSDNGGSTALATTEASENLDPPTACTDFIGKTVWYRYAPSSNVAVTVDTIGSSAGFDTVLVAWDGTALASLTRVGCDDDSGGSGSGQPSKIASLALVAGHTYYFQVGGYKQLVGDTADSGIVKFNIGVAPTSNDAFAGAIVIGSLSYTDTGRSTATATTEASEPLKPSCLASTDSIGKTVWYKFVPGSTMTVTADTIGSGFDTVIVIYSGTSIGALTERKCDDDGASATTHESLISSFTLTGGTTYYLQVGGWQGATGPPYSGNLTFHLKTP